jgi:hypothetical protein
MAVIWGLLMTTLSVVLNQRYAALKGCKVLTLEHEKLEVTLTPH